jgi:uncharacterized protein
LAIKLFKEPQLNDPVLLASWPGIGNVGLIVVDTFRRVFNAEVCGEIEPWDYFYPRKVRIKNGELVELQFPNSLFYFKKTEKQDLLLFIGEEQPSWSGRAYARGIKAYQMANQVLDVAIKFGCRRIYTSGAAVTSIHHSLPSRVWAVPNNGALLPEIKDYENTVLMSQIESLEGQGNISGLNGLLLGAARKRGLDGICLMGEIPVYLQDFPILYPKASKSVVEVLAKALNLEMDLTGLSSFAELSETEINTLYDKLPTEVKTQLEELKSNPAQNTRFSGKITEEDKKHILEDLDKMFGKKEKGETN